MKTNNLLILVVVLLVWTPLIRAGPAGNGQSVPSIDVLNSGLSATNIPLNYDDASYNPAPNLTLSTNVVQNLNRDVYKHSSIRGFYSANPDGLGGHRVEIPMEVPYAWPDAKPTIALPSRPASRRESDNLGLGEVELWPFMLDRIQNDFTYDMRLAVYSPNGQSATGQPDNAGSGFSTFEPQVTFGWLSSRIGMEVSVYSGLGFNKENTTLDYRSGEFFHLDTTVAKHWPFLGGMFGFGVNGFYLRQVNANNASGTQPGSIKRRSAGGGPLIFYVHDIGKNQFIFEVKWLPKINVREKTIDNLVRIELALNF